MLMNDAEYVAAEERLSKLPFPGVFKLWQYKAALTLDGEFTLDQLEQIARAMRGPHVESGQVPPASPQGSPHEHAVPPGDHHKVAEG